jgi:hypothetical protein
MALSHSAIRTNPQCTICTNNYKENVNHVLLECEAYTNLRNELNSDITTLFCGQNVDANFTGLPPHGKMMARSLSLEPRKSFILIKYLWVLPVILNVLYKCKLDFVSIWSSSFLRVNSAFLDRQRISYFTRFSKLNSTRLCKQTFDELFSEVHKGFPNSTLLNSPCFPRILTIPFSLFSKFSFRYLRI